jgi:hypothetical protein
MNNLNDLFSLLQEEKRKKSEFEEKIKAAARKDFNEVFKQLSPHSEPKEIVEEVLVETKPISTPIGEIPASQQNPAIADLPDIDKYLRTPQVSEPNTSEYDINLINKKIKFLEQWIGKINNAGPGGGEVNLRYLDDVDRNTIADNRYLRYSSATKKFIFDDVDAVGEYFTAIDTTNQTFSASVPKIITINTAGSSRNISIADGSKITFSKTGSYNVQYSLQAVNADNAQWDISIWVTKNGVNIDDSNSIFTIPVRKNPSTYGKLILTSPIAVDVTAGDYVQLMGHTEASLVSLPTIAADVGNGIPRTPSVIVVVTKL